MKNTRNQHLNKAIISGFLNGKTIEQLAAETSLDITYITLVLYQEGIHYSNKEIFSEILHQHKGHSLS